MTPWVWRWQRARRLAERYSGALERERVLHDELAQRNALDELHGDIEAAFPCPLAVEFDDVGMVGQSDDLGLL